MYKTGDKARWRRDGSLEFIGRVDQQAKVRGFRVEPGEIESVLLEHPGVRDAAVITREDGPGKQIVAFVESGGRSRLTVQELRYHVKSLLPFYLRPACYILLEKLPLNANGKIDRASLARMRLPEDTGKGNLPRTSTEKVLCRIWADILHLESVGVEDDFFALGGHSLLAVNLASRITQRFGHELTLDKIFQYSTPREMADWMKRDEKGSGDPGLV